MNIRENMIIDIETEVSDSESDSKTLKFLVDEDLKDLGYNVHSLQVQPAKRHPDPNGDLPMTESDLKGLTKAYRYDFSILKAVSVRLSLTHLELVWDRLPPEVIENVAAILYLAERFELGGKKDV